MKLQYETINFDEFAMMDAVLECCQNPFKHTAQIAKDHGVPVEELYKEFVANQALTHGEPS